MTDATPNRTYKATVFEMIFSDKKNLLELYNAVNDTNYTDPELLEINTLKNAIYMTMHNDLSFIIDFHLNLYEHQSTYNPNLPLRFLLYISDLFSEIIRDKNIYSKKLLELPSPRFLVFYNGMQKRPEQEVLTLSTAFQLPQKDVALELKVLILNINPGYNESLKQTCRTLCDYSEYTERVRKYAKEMPVDTAVKKAVSECIHENILADFLKKHQTEAIKMSIYEYDYEEHMRMEREENWADGHAQGLADGHAQGLADGRMDLLKHAFQNGATPNQLVDLLGATTEELQLLSLS